MKIKVKYIGAILISLILIIILYSLSINLGVVSPFELPSNFLGSLLGALIGAIITLVLLKGQAEVVEKKDKNIRILEKKARVFQDYIKDVWKVWEDQKITIEEFQNLTSKYYQNLMIYLSENNRLKKIGEYLSKMGECIGKNSYEDSIKLRNNIKDLINELSDDLELGGNVDTEIMDEHDKIVFPLIFRNSVLDAVKKALPIGEIFEEGKLSANKYEEYISFEFKKYKGCRINIRGLFSLSFNSKNDLNDDQKNLNNFLMRYTLEIDERYQKFNDFRDDRYSYREWIRIKEFDNNLLKPLNDDEDKVASMPINLSYEKSKEFFRTKQREFPDLLTKRIKHQFDNTKIGDDDLLEFLEKYYEKP